MQLFACDYCRAPVYFDNYKCMSCGHALAFLPDQRTMSALEPLPIQQEASAQAAVDEMPAGPPQEPANGAETAPGQQSQESGQEPPVTPQTAPVRYQAIAASGRIYRMCQNHIEHAACSWAVPDEDPEPLCLACRLNNVIPDLTKKEQKEAWLRLEAAKRRLLYSLFLLKLPVESRAERPDDGLAFAFMAGAKDEPVFTGHSDGLITINVAEADDPFREKIRAQLGEAYRTVLGHFRHEIGHYFWDRLVKDSDWLEEFRSLFGDETLDYQEALDRHYKEGAPQDWGQRFVSQYASMHPWEDWAETWAHYLHMFDTLETAKAYGLRVKVSKGDEGSTVVNAADVRVDDFQQMADDWVPLTLALNSLNRSMGMSDLYPFVLTDTALNKLRFVHKVIRSASSAAREDARRSEREASSTAEATSQAGAQAKTKRRSFKEAVLGSRRAS
jgi:hypothetical protein